MAAARNTYLSLHHNTESPRDRAVFVPAISALDTQKYTVPELLQIRGESVSERCGGRELRERMGPLMLEQTTLNLHGERNIEREEQREREYGGHVCGKSILSLCVCECVCMFVCLSLSSSLCVSLDHDR